MISARALSSSTNGALGSMVLRPCSSSSGGPLPARRTSISTPRMAARSRPILSLPAIGLEAFADVDRHSAACLDGCREEAIAGRLLGAVLKADVVVTAFVGAEALKCAAQFRLTLVEGG